MKMKLHMKMKVKMQMTDEIQINSLQIQINSLAALKCRLAHSIMRSKVKP